MKNNSTNNEIPIFFSTDDNYAPYLEVAIRSLSDNASDNFNYRIVVLNTGLQTENIDKIKALECDNLKIDFVDITEKLKYIKDKLRNVYHFSLVTYYRLFIASLFPGYKKIIYLDCDLVVLGDISQLYCIDIGDNIIAAAPEEFVQNTKEFREYAEFALGVDPDRYVNAGVLVMNLEEFRKSKIEERFVELIKEYNFDLLDPDQAYLNYLCYGRIYTLPNGWNKEPMPICCEGKKNIVHYALYKKPWQYDDVTDGEYFWQYAKQSPFYDLIKDRMEGFSDSERLKKEEDSKEILIHAGIIISSDCTFVNKLGSLKR